MREFQLITNSPMFDFFIWGTMICFIIPQLLFFKKSRREKWYYIKYSLLAMLIVLIMHSILTLEEYKWSKHYGSTNTYFDIWLLK